MLSPEYIKAIFLGIVQGITEFLPVSSKGHLVLLQGPVGRWLGVPSTAEDDLRMIVAVHLGTLFSLLVVYRRDLVRMLYKPGNPRLCIAICVATVPLVLVGLWLRRPLEELFSSPLAAGYGLLVTSLMLFGAHRLERGSETADQIRMRTAAIVGLFQACAVIPGISRSGSSISGGLLAGLNRESAVTFSFLIALPAIGGAATLKGYEIATSNGAEVNYGELIAGALTAFVVGTASLKWLLAFVRGRRLHYFAIYCACVGLLTIATYSLESGGPGGEQQEQPQSARIEGEPPQPS